MAGGKLSPRQKMINLMYLIFIAMLAMQMDKKVLSSFGFMKEKIETANDVSARSIQGILNGLQQKADDQPEKFKDLNDKAKQISRLSDDLFDYIKNLKDTILVDVDEEDKENYESMSSGDRVDELFFTGDKFTPKGNEFLNKVNGYRDAVIAIVDNEPKLASLKTHILKRFNTDPQPAREEGSPKIPWLKSRYEGMPMITTIANITQMQGDVKTTETEIYSNLLGGQLEIDSKLTTNNYKGIVRLEKTAYFAGERVKGQVVLGRYDDQLVPSKVTLGTQDITNRVQNGQVMLDMPAGNVGNKTFKGVITFMQDGEPQDIPFESEYSVIAEPNDAIVSADKMNVVYRGLDNPISISVPGVGDKDITSRVTGNSRLTRTGLGKYMMRPGTGNEVTINVSAKLSSGKTITTPKKFRIKDIPAAMGTVRGDFGVVRMPKTSLSRTPIGAGLPDFVFDLKLDVQGFTVKVPGQLAVKVNGTQLDARAKSALAKARRGDVITIFDIKATIRGNSSYVLKRVLPVSIEITN